MEFRKFDYIDRVHSSQYDFIRIYGDSPYQSLGACAGNHYLIDLDRLADEGLLKK